jgi:hypothetical protein
MGFRVLLISQHLFREILVEVVLSVYAEGIKIKKFLHPDVVTMHLLRKGFMKDYLCWYAHGGIFVCDESMVERMVGSTSSASNVHEVVNDNNNPYRNMVMDVMRMN